MGDEAFPMQIVKPNKVKITTSWFCKGLAKSSKKKRKLYSKYQEKKTQLRPMKFFIKTIVLYFKESTEEQNQIIIQRNFKNTQIIVKRTWKIMKTVIGYSKSFKQKFPDYFFEGGGGVDGDFGPANTPPPPEPPPVQQQPRKDKVSSKKVIDAGFIRFFPVLEASRQTKLKIKIQPLWQISTIRPL